MQRVIVNGKELIVEEFYPFRYDYGKGKEVLRIKIAEANHSFEEVKALDNTSLEECPVIEYWEDEAKKNDYTGYGVDFSSNYVEEGGKKLFSIEITRQGATEMKLTKVEADLEIANSTINDLTIMVTDLMFGESTEV